MAILAQAADTAARAPQAAEKGFFPIQLFWEQVTMLDKVEAATFISFGVIWLFYGWRIFRILVTISSALAGLSLGIWLNRILIGGNEVWLGIIFMALLALFSLPMMKWGVTILGAVAGGILTGAIWIAVQLPEKYILAGAVVGIIAGGMISFIVFKIAVMLFTSLGGSVLVLMGVLALLYKYLDTPDKVQEWVFNLKWFLPAALLVPTAIGIFLQNHFIKKSKDWNI